MPITQRVRCFTADRKVWVDDGAEWAAHWSMERLADYRDAGSTSSATR